MPKIHKLRSRERIKQKRQYDARGQAGKRAVAMREIGTVLRFWKYCGDGGCKRAKACTGDGEACFRYFWPHVPEEVKVALRAHIKASLAGLSKPEIAAHIESELRRWREIEAKAAADAAPREPPPRPRLPAQPRVRAL